MALPAAAGDVVLNLFEHQRRRPLGRGRDLVDGRRRPRRRVRVAATSAGNDLLAEAAAGLRTVVERGARGRRDPRPGADLRAPRRRRRRRRPAFPVRAAVAADTGDDPGRHDKPDDDTDDKPDDTDDDSDKDDNPQVTPAVVPVVVPDHKPPPRHRRHLEPAEADMSPTTTTAAAGTLAATRAPAGLPTPRTPRPSRVSARSCGCSRGRPNRPQGRLYVNLFGALQTPSPGATNLFAALSDITPGAASVNDVMQIPQWLGEVWDGLHLPAPLHPAADLSAADRHGDQGLEVGRSRGRAVRREQGAGTQSNAPTTEPHLRPDPAADRRRPRH